MDEQNGWRLAQYGLAPKTLQGLRGILFMPFLHSGYSHLFNNSVPLLVLGGALFYTYRGVAFNVIFFIALICGFGTWVMGEQGSVHIGASGVVYGLAGFLFLSGALRKQAQLLALSLLVVFMYGSMIWGVLPIQKNVSWEGHLWGGVAGFIMAIVYRKKGPPKKVYQWEIDEKMEEEIFDDYQDLSNEREKISSTSHFKIVYHYKKQKDPEDQNS